jgi:NACalpha-BTF3-like transcription factor
MVDVGLHQLLHDFMDKLQGYYKVELDKEHVRQMQELKEKDPELEVLKDKIEADRNDKTADGTFACGSASRKRPNRRAKRSAKIAEILEAMRRGYEDFYKKEVEKDYMGQMHEREEKYPEREVLKEQNEADRKNMDAVCPAMPAACFVVGDDVPNDELFTSLFKTMQEDSFQKVLADTLRGADGDAGESAGVAPIFPAPVGREDNDVKVSLKGFMECFDIAVDPDGDSDWALRARTNRNVKKRAQKKRAQAARGSQAAPAKKIDPFRAPETDDDDESGRVPNDVDLVMSHALCSRRIAKAALLNNNGDVVYALSELAGLKTRLVLGVGSIVYLVGLNAVAFNGRTGTVTAFDEASERWAVTFADGYETKLFKAVNIVVTVNPPVAAVVEAERDTDDSSIMEAEDEGDDDGSGIEPWMIHAVRTTTPCSRGKAIAALRANNNDIVEAFEWLVPSSASAHAYKNEM